MTEAHSIRNAADEADLAAIAQLFRAYSASLPVDLGYQGFDTELDTLPGNYAPPRGALFLARNDRGHPVGCVGMRPLAGGDGCELKRLYVAPAGRGAGLGRALCVVVAEAARRAGYRAIYLDTLPSMGAAQSLYHSLGFEEIAPYYDTPVAGTKFFRLLLDGQPAWSPPR